MVNGIFSHELHEKNLEPFCSVKFQEEATDNMSFFFNLANIFFAKEVEKKT